MLRLDVPFTTTHGDPLDNIVELADIAGPMMPLQDRQCVGRDTSKTKSPFLTDCCEEGVEKIRNILGTVP
jgi:hypothetical protein